jgi:hypothetical protein
LDCRSLAFEVAQMLEGLGALGIQVFDVATGDHPEELLSSVHNPRTDGVWHPPVLWGDFEKDAISQKSHLGVGNLRGLHGERYRFCNDLGGR